MKPWVIVVVMLAVLAAGSNVHAEHTADHRYTVWGYVTNADGEPIKDALVAVTERPDVRLGTVRTSANGRYSMRLHLHNSDLGRLLTVEANNVSYQIRVPFDPDNTTSERSHRVDFRGSQAQEILPSYRSLIPSILLALGAAVVLVPALRYVTGRGKHKGRAARQKRWSAGAPARRRSPPKK
jgi:hypothetical protein